MKFQLYMEGYLPQTATVIIEAKDEIEAEEIDWIMAKEGDIDWEDCDQSCYRTEVVEVSRAEEDAEADNI
ncbi:hypothetical protein ABIB38_004781 [Massilia sp. UYP11]|uniref:hypothetical protein n=1 Tax=Massilia sp. UYP11 TaxID=1756385 RepID=UPI003D1A36DA